MTAQPSIGVFVSSTFSDMQDERDECALRVFPELRQVCEAHGFVWTEVDLRWGVTAEQIDEGLLLPICFSEIDQCTPFFVAFLGERYGSRLPSIPDDMLRAHPWLAGCAGASVTELEILYALRNPNLNRLFLLRDDGGRVDSCSADGEALARLKAKIATADGVVRTYATATEAGEIVRQILAARLAAILRQRSFADGFEKEDYAQHTFARRAAHGVVPRAAVASEIDRWLSSGRGLFCLAGPAGSGKTAALARLSSGLAARGLPPAKGFLGSLFRSRRGSPFRVFTHFVEAAPASASWTTITLRLLRWLRREFGLELPQPRDGDELRLSVERWLYAVPGSEQVLILIDGVDHLAPRPGALELAWLPETLPRNCRVVLSGSDAAVVQEVVRRGGAVFTMPPMDERERLSLVEERLQSQHKSLPGELVEILISRSRNHQPLYLDAALEELRVFGDFGRLPERVREVSAESTTALFAEAVRRREEDYDAHRPHLVRDTLCLLAVCAGGLSARELADLLGGDDGALPSGIWAPLLLSLEGHVLDRGGLLRIRRPELLQVISERWLGGANERSVRGRVCDYLRGHPSTSRKLFEYPEQLAVLGRWEELASFLGSPDVMEAAWRQERFRTAELWRAIEDASAIRAAHVFAPYERLEATVLVHVVELLESLSHGVDAEAAMRVLEQVARRAANDSALQAALNRKAILLKQRGDLGAALAALLEEEVLCSRLGERASLAACVGNQGVVLRAKGEYRRAADRFVLEESLCREISDFRALMTNCEHRAALLVDEGDLTGALALFRQQESLARKLSDHGALASAFSGQAVVLARRRKSSAALDLLAGEEKIRRATGDLANLQTCLGNMAVLYISRADYDRADQLLDERERLCRSIGGVEGLVATLLQRAYLDDAIGSRKSSLEHLNQAARLASENALTHLLGKTRELAEQLTRPDSRY